MEVVFYQRDFSRRVALRKSVKVEVERYSWNQVGGPDYASLRMSGSIASEEVVRFLRYPVEIWDEGKCLWWGFVNRVVAPRGARQRIGVSLDELYNYVIVAYADGDTSAASDTNSINEYGQRETRLNNTNATQTEAEAARDLWLASHQYAPPDIDFSGGNNEIEIGCYGWYSTLGWKYYSNTSASNVDYATQISAIVTASGQFIQGTILEDTAGVTSNEYRDGHSTALTYINQLLNAGTSNTRPLLAYVDRQRYLHVYERPAAPPTNKPKYLIRDDGKLITDVAKVIPDKEAKTAVWAKVQDVPGSGGFASMPPFFIADAEYNGARDETTYRFADAYEQIRLARWVASVVSGESSGSSSGSYLPYFPTESFIPAPRPTLHRTTTGTSADISSTNYYIQVATTPASDDNLTYNGLSYFTPGTDTTGKYAWEILVSGIYNFKGMVWLQSGTTPPTAGTMNARILKKDTSYTAFDNSGVGVPAGGMSGEYLYLSLFGRVQLDAGDYVLLSMTDTSDGDIQVYYAELIGTFERATG